MIFKKIEEERKDMILHEDLGILTFKTALSNACVRWGPKPDDKLGLGFAPYNKILVIKYFFGPLILNTASCLDAGTLER